MKVSASDVFECDYTNLEACKRLADALAADRSKPQIVYKQPDRPNYNITFAERTDLFEPEWVVYRTPVN